MKTHINKFFIFSLLAFTISLRAYTQAFQSQNNNIWLHYFGKNILSTRLSFPFETSFRFANGYSEKQQYFVRPSLDYQFTKHFVGSLGYSYYLTYSYGNPANNKIPVPENRGWLQAQLTHKFGDLKITNRLPNENRLVGLSVKGLNCRHNIDHYVCRNRFRYMLFLNCPLINDEKKASKVSGILGDKVFLNIGGIAAISNAETSVGATLFDQNLVIADFGGNIHPITRFN